MTDGMSEGARMSDEALERLVLPCATCSANESCRNCRLLSDFRQKREG